MDAVPPADSTAVAFKHPADLLTHQTLSAMHELSIAMKVIEEVERRRGLAGGGRVIAVTLRIGRLSTVQEGALRYSFALAGDGTALAGARLAIIDVPVRIWCAACAAERELAGIQRLACPECGTLSGDIRAGRELDLESIEFEAPDDPTADAEPLPAIPQTELSP